MNYGSLGRMLALDLLGQDTEVVSAHSLVSRIVPSITLAYDKL